MRISEFIDDFDNPAVAHEIYLAELRTLAAQGDFMAGISLRLVEWAQGAVVQFDQGFINFGRPKALDPHWRPSAFVFAGDAGHRFYTRKINEMTVIVVDSELLCRLFLFLFFCWS
jgi:hypothetical protein